MALLLFVLVGWQLVGNSLWLFCHLPWGSVHVAQKSFGIEGQLVFKCHWSSAVYYAISTASTRFQHVYCA